MGRFIKSGILFVSLATLCGCGSYGPSEVSSHQFGDGECIRLLIDGRSQDMDVPGWSLTLTSDNSDPDHDRNFCGLVSNDAAPKFSVKKITSKDGEAVGFCSTSFAKDSILIVYDSKRMEGEKIWTYKSGSHGGGNWDSRTNELLELAKESGLVP